MDSGPGKSVGISLDQKTGNMTLAWSADQTTLSWMILIGPANQRVRVGTNISSKVTNPLDFFFGPKGVNYKEQIQWRDAATGKLLAASDFFSPHVSRLRSMARLRSTHIRRTERRPYNGVEGLA